MLMVMEKLTNLKPISLYWKCQIIGWSSASLYWAYLSFFRDNFGILNSIVNYFADITICIGLTHLYRNYALRAKWRELPFSKLLLRAIPFLLGLAISFMLIMNAKAYCFQQHISSFSSVFTEWNPVFITGIRLVAIWMLAYHLYFYYRREINTTKANAQLSVIAKQAQLENLSAQLNPHFLFNSLNSIKSLVIENPHAARRSVDLLSDLLRSSLYRNDEKLISIRSEISLVKDYIELEKLRFEERLEVVIDIEKCPENLKIPPLSIQLLVENAIKHGIEKSIKGGLVQIIVNKEGDYIHIEVQNSGKLKTGPCESGIGIKNLKERLAIQYRGEASFKIKQNSNEIVVATIKIPVIK